MGVSKGGAEGKHTSALCSIRHPLGKLWGAKAALCQGAGVYCASICLIQIKQPIIE